MPLNPCIQCGCDVRLRASRMSYNRKRGVVHYLEHDNHFQPCDAVKGFTSTMFKPYQPSGKQPCDEMMARWNAKNPPATTILSLLDGGRDD